jgi:hypothetical protein
MKKLLSLSFIALLISSAVSAQYYVIPYTTAKENPKGLNTDTEYPVGGGIPAGWTSIHPGSATSAAWSTIANIPFTFNFNGSPVTSYKVSTSGVLTFTTGTSMLPAIGNAILPAADVPDNSICVRGLSGYGVNDNIVTKTFGTTPNRQHWVTFNSYSQVGSANCFTYWSIVLEEGSDRIYIVDQRHANCTLNMTLGIQINSTTSVMVAGSPNVTPKAGNDFTPADNAYYEFVFGTQPTLDASISEISTPTYLALPNAPFTISGKVRNMGSSNLTEVTVSYSVNNGTPVSTTYNGLNVTSFNTYTFNHPATWTPTASGLYTIKVWTSDPNGSTDLNPANDTLSKSLMICSILIPRRSLLEHFTNASCAPCAAQNPAFHALLGQGNNPNLVTKVTYHVSWPGADPMYSFNTADPTARVTYYGVTGVPHVSMDGTAYRGSPGGVTQTVINTVSAKPAFYEISGTADLTGTNLVIGVTSTSRINFLAGSNHTVQVALVEHPVDYAVAPGTNGEKNFPSVMRKLFPSPTGSTIGAPLDGQVNTFNFNYTVPATFVANNLKVVAWVQDAAKDVFQAVEFPVNVVIGVNEVNNGISSLSLFPNPAGVETGINFNLTASSEISVRIMNMAGEEVLVNNFNTMSAGNHHLKLNTSSLSNGLYVVQIRTATGSVTQKLSVTK